jgi:hypothetical protein
MKKTIVGGLLVGGLLTGAALVASPANAYYGTHNVTSTVAWGGADCIPIEAPLISNPYQTGTVSFCGGHSYASYTAPNGALIGANPMMGNADWLSCQVYLDGALVYSDYGTAGDGHDINCLRRIL